VLVIASSRSRTFREGDAAGEIVAAGRRNQHA
jgi:hypothetical protein